MSQETCHGCGIPKPAALEPLTREERAALTLEGRQKVWHRVDVQYDDERPTERRYFCPAHALPEDEPA